MSVARAFDRVDWAVHKRTPGNRTDWTSPNGAFINGRFA